MTTVEEHSSTVLLVAIKAEQALLYSKQLGYFTFKVAVAGTTSIVEASAPPFDLLSTNVSLLVITVQGKYKIYFEPDRHLITNQGCGDVINALELSATTGGIMVTHYGGTNKNVFPVKMI